MRGSLGEARSRQEEQEEKEQEKQQERPHDLPTVVKTVQQKNMDPKKVHLSGLCSQMDLNPLLILASTSLSTSSWAEEPLPGSISRVSVSGGAGLVWLWGGGRLTCEVLDRVHHLGQEVAVLLLPAGGGTSLDVLEEERAQRGVDHQGQAEQHVGKQPSQARRTPPGPDPQGWPPLDAGRHGSCLGSARQCARSLLHPASYDCCSAHAALGIAGLAGWLPLSLSLSLSLAHGGGSHHNWDAAQLGRTKIPTMEESSAKRLRVGRMWTLPRRPSRLEGRTCVNVA